MTPAPRPARSRAYRAFCREFLACLGRLGIAGLWDVRFHLEPGLDAQAEVECDIGDRVVSVRFGHLDANYSARLLARHEVAHVLLAELAAIGRDRFAQEAAMDRAEETICTVLEKVLP